MIEITDIEVIKKYTVKIKGFKIMVTYNISEDYLTALLFDRELIFLYKINEIVYSEQTIIELLQRHINKLLYRNV